MDGGTLPRGREGFPAWGFALVALLALMLGANGSMVWLSSRGHRDLVRPDYYDAGLDQDGVMARNGLARDPAMEIGFRRGGAHWNVEAASGRLGAATCRIELYRPEDGREDKVLELGLPQTGNARGAKTVWSVPAPALRKGFWVAKLIWEENGKPILEESLRIYVDG